MHFLRRQRQKTVALIILALLTALFLIADLCLISENNTLRAQLGETPGASPDAVSPSPDAATAPPSPTPEESSSPTPPPTMDVTGLSGYQALFPDLYVEPTELVDRGDEKIAYLTFDDGPSELTEQFLQVLDQYGAKATFFVVPKGTEESNERMRKVLAAGHTIGIHSKSHDYKKIYASVEAFLTDFHEAYQEVVDATGYHPSVFRFPGGSVNSYNKETRADIIAEMTRRGFVYYDWNVSTQDASNSATPEDLYQGVAGYALEYNHPQVLMHDSAPQQKTLDTLPKILDFFKQNGYSFQSLEPSVKPAHF